MLYFIENDKNNIKRKENYITGTPKRQKSSATVENEEIHKNKRNFKIIHSQK